MPGIIDVAKLVSNTINSNEYSAALSASDPLSAEISTEEFEKIQSQIKGLLTLESAANNPELLKAIKPKLLPELEGEKHAQLKKSIYDNVEEKISGIGEKLGLDLKGKKVDEQLDLLAKHKNSNGGSDATIEKYQKLQEDFANFKQESENKIKEKEQSFIDYKIDSSIRNKMQSMKLAKPYQEDLVRESIYEGALKQIKQKAKITFGEDGNMRLLDKNNPEIELYQDNKKLGIDDLINPLMQPYLQVADPEKSKKPEEREIRTDDKTSYNPNSTAGQLQQAKRDGVIY